MACALNKDQVVDLYEVIYGEIYDRINDKKLPVFNIETLIKEVYDAIESPENPGKGLLYAQAVPDILTLVSMDDDVKKYLKGLRDKKLFSLDDLADLADEFSDLDNVLKYVTPEQESFDDIQERIIDHNTNKYNFDIVDGTESDLIWTEKQFKGQKASSAYMTVPQQAKAISPEFVTDENRNLENPEAALIYDVIQSITYLTRERPLNTDDVIYDGKKLKLRIVESQSIKDKLISDDRDFLDNNPFYKGVVAVVSDEEGNMLYFDKEGKLTTEGNGIIVYQNIRNTVKINNKISLTSRSGRHQTLASPEDIVRTIRKQQEDAGLVFDEKYYIDLIAEKKEQQKKEINNLYNLRQKVINNPSDVVVLPIVGGSFGIINTKYVPLSQTNLTEKDLQNITVNTIKGSKKAGYTTTTISREKAGISMDIPVVLQRGDMPESLAEKIATVLTTQAKLNGQPLDAERRKAYAEHFLSNAIESNRIVIGTKDVEGVTTLTVKLIPNYDEIESDNSRKHYEKIDLSKPDAFIKIKSHLLKAKRIQKTGSNDNVFYPANISYNNKDLKNGNFIDYIIEGNTITEKDQNYFDFVKEYIKIEYSKDSMILAGFNSYLKFDIPEDVLSTIPYTEFEEGTEDVEDEVVEVVYNEKSKKITSTNKEYKELNAFNIDSTDATINIGRDFNKSIPAAIRKQAGKKNVPVELSSKVAKISKPALDKAVLALNKLNVTEVHIAGDTIADLKDLTQDKINEYVYDLLERLNKALDTPITKVVTSGQSGVAQAATIAAEKLGLSIDINVPKQWLFKKKDGSDSKTKKAFLARFNVKTAEVTKEKTKEELSDEEQFKSINSNDIGNLLRGKTFAKLFARHFDKKDIAKAEKWWAESPLSQTISLERITTIVNSNAFASWSGFGITLYEADGGTAVDLYHEAWHGFSQLYLTLEQKQELYDTMKRQDKWKNASYLDIEEALAEDFRSYAKGEYKPTGVIGRIFKKMLDFLKAMFSKITRRDMLRPRDIASVKELYDKLYKGELIDLQPSLNNRWTDFDVLNRAKTIETFDGSVFTIDEASLVSKSVDSIIASIISKYNTDRNVTNGAQRIFHNEQNRAEIYRIAKVKIQQRLDAFTAQLEKITLENAESEEPDYFKEETLLNKVMLLNKVIDNYGDIQKSLDGKTKKGVVAFNIANTRFDVLKDTFVEVEDDASEIGQTRVVKESTNGNIMSSKSLASEETMMLLAGIFKMTKSESGELVHVENALGFEELENVDKIWNKLARVLQGQLDPVDMYNVISKYRENYFEFQQLLNVLSNPFQLGPGNVGTISEFDSETNFWQDFKKPRIPYVKLNINKTITQKEYYDRATNTMIPEIATYESRLANASFDVYKVINEWENNLKTSDLESNAYIKTDDLLRNYIDIPKILKTFGTQDGIFKAKYSQEFLKAIGIEMDQESMEIQNIMSKPRFSSTYGIDRIFNIIQIVNRFAVSGTEEQKLAAEEFARNPVKYLLNGLPNELLNDKESISGNEEVRARLRTLAEIQNMFSNSFSNFSVLTPEGNRVFEHFMDSTLTRNMTAINKVDNFTELTSNLVDINNRYRHMRWLSNDNNPFTKHSVLLNSIFILDPLSPDYGKRRPDGYIDIKNVSGTELITNDSSKSEGATTSSSDRTTKYLQEINTMLLRGVQEFMRHASKQMSQSLTTPKINTYPGKKADYLYVDIAAFKPNNLNKGANEAFNILLKYIASEHERINRFNANINDKSITGKDKFSNWSGYNRKVRTKNGEEKLAGSVFTAFDDVLTQDTKDALYAIKSDLLKYLQTDESLLNQIRKDVNTYFEKQTQANLNRLQKARYVDTALVELVDSPELSREQVDEVLMKAYTYNSWIHNFETVILTYGDLAQYNHDKEEFHKRNAGLTSPGRGFRTDLRAQSFINGPLFKKLYTEKSGYKARAYDGTLNTAIIKEKEVEISEYYDEYREALYKDWVNRLKNNDTLSEKEKVEYANKMADTEVKEYTGMKEGDGQGHITFDAYRMLKKLEGNWSDAQEELYRKIVNGETVNPSDVVEFFPPYKLQYFGNIETTGLSLVSFHKFSLAPLIPSVLSGSKLNALHNLMMKNQMDYVVFESGSKIGHITSNGEGDVITNKDGLINPNAEFTNNVVFVENLKNQTEINKVFKEKSIFSTQLRKLILEGLYEKGIITTTDETQITNDKVVNYINHVSELSSLLKLELLNEIGFEQVTDTDGNAKYVPIGKDSTEKLASFIRANLEKEDVLGDHLIEFITTTEDGELKFDLSLHPEASKIEKLILSIINKRLIKQKVHGEPLVQVSAAMYEGVFDGSKLKNATKADIKKYVGSNFLPTYHQKADGSTAAMKVMVALQGDFINTLKLKDKEGNTIGTIDKLNELIKDDEWLDMDNNRNAITMVGVRIPVQGLNSMEFMEVYHFLPAEAGNIIVAPTEIVAKSGGDFDIDKMTIFMPNVSESGEYIKREFASHKELDAAVSEAKANGEDLSKIFKKQKAALENLLIQDIKNILSLPENYASLIRPNGTYLLKPIADELAQYVMDYSPLQNMMSDTPNENAKQDKKSGKYPPVISPTRVLESLYNIYKHESNVVGKKTLGLGAIENTFHTLFNSIGASMPSTYYHSKEKLPRDVRIFLKHNTLINNNEGSADYGKEVISLSNRYDADNVNKIADLFSQAINGWVDVEKDAWIFFIQGNYEVAPILLYLLKTGVPVREAIYFVSQPLVREYVEEQRLAKSTFAKPLGKSVKSAGLIKVNASKNVLTKYFDKNIKNDAKYNATTELANKVFEGRKNKEFTKEEMLNLIKESKTNPEAAKSDLSKLMFLHYIELEQQMNGIKKLKMNANADTSLKTTFSQIENTESSLENLKDETKLDQTLLWKMVNDSVTSSFFNGPLALQVGRPLFKMRYHPLITKWMIINDQDIRNSLPKTFGENNRDQYVDTFRNDMVSLILQNTLRQYNIDKFYKSYNVEESIPVEFVNLPKYGVYVKPNKSGIPTMYIDKIALEKEFENKSWSKSATDELSYTNKGLYPLPISTFMNNGNSNKEEYFRYVAEREYLRSITPFNEVSKTDEFIGELKKIKESKKTLPYEKQVRLAYEKIISDKALSNTFNPSHLFKNAESAFAIRLNNILIKYPKLKLDYDVLEVMKVDSDKENKLFNIYVTEKDYTNAVSNIYHKNLLDLANPQIKKVADEAENKYISDFFSQLPLFAFLQSGLNKTKFNFVNIVDYTPFIDVVESEKNKLISLLNNEEKGLAFLDQYYKAFNKQNNIYNSEKSRFKDYFMNMTQEKGATKSEYTLEPTINEFVYKYNDGDLTNVHYKNLVNANPTTVFINSTTDLELRDPGKQFKGQSYINKAAKGMNIALITALNNPVDNLSTVPASKYSVVKNKWEEAIQNMKELIESGNKIALSSKGYGDSTVMPQELFVYLSRRLYEEFGYINPNSTMFTDMLDLVAEKQGISDAEINSLFTEEEDPFKC